MSLLVGGETNPLLWCATGLMLRHGFLGLIFLILIPSKSAK